MVPFAERMIVSFARRFPRARGVTALFFSTKVWYETSLSLKSNVVIASHGVRRVMPLEPPSRLSTQNTTLKLTVISHRDTFLSLGCGTTRELHTSICREISGMDCIHAKQPAMYVVAELGLVVLPWDARVILEPTLRHTLQYA